MCRLRVAGCARGRTRGKSSGRLALEEWRGAPKRAGPEEGVRASGARGAQAVAAENPGSSPPAARPRPAAWQVVILPLQRPELFTRGALTKPTKGAPLRWACFAVAAAGAAIASALC